MRRKFLYYMVLLTLPTSIGFCNGSQKGSNENMVNIWMTTGNQDKLLEPQPSVNFAPTKSTNDDLLIQVDENAVYQQMDGFGASLTDASAWLIDQKLDSDSRQNLLTKLFDYKNGIGLSFLRQPIGATDYSIMIYSYDDVQKGQTDPQLTNFTVDHDSAYIIPLLKEALKINPALKVMASPWSAPAWMKDNQSMIGQTDGIRSSLKKEFYSSYAEYFVKFIQAYETEGIPIYAITVQNEPHFTPDKYPGMLMTDKEQSNFIQQYLGPAFAKNKISAKIICWDHNWDETDFSLNVLGSDKGNYVTGSAWHFYGGSPKAMTKVHDKFPEKGIWFTEGSGGSWGNGATWKGAFLDQMSNIIHIPRNWGKTVVWWNMALDQENGPTVLPKSTCRGIVTIDQNSGDVKYNVDYYTMGHISKFVLPGAYRIESNSFEGELDNVAFKNPDGSKVLIVFNRTSESKTFKVAEGLNTFEYTIPGESAATFQWQK